jgi:hypothetical protein
MHMISVCRKWTSSVHVTKVAHRHIKMTDSLYSAQLPEGCACLYCSTLQYNSHTYGGEQFIQTGKLA